MVPNFSEGIRLYDNFFTASPLSQDYLAGLIVNQEQALVIAQSPWFADQRLDQRIRRHSAMSIQTDKTRLMIKAIPHPKTEWVNGS